MVGIAQLLNRKVYIPNILGIVTMDNKEQFDLSNKELNIEVLKLIGIEGRTFIDIKGKDYLLIDIENALIKGIGVNCLK